MSRPVIFISAVSRELRTTRDLVAKTLITLGYEPKWQDIATTETGDIKSYIRKAINESDAVIQLVGHCYGESLAKSDPEFGAVSYTQYEALYAKKLGKPIWYIVIDNNHPVDAERSETTLLQRKQFAYREKIHENEKRSVKSRDLKMTESLILSLRPYLRSVTLKPKGLETKSKAVDLFPPEELSRGIQELTTSEFLLHYRDRHLKGEKTKPFCFILGAGASVQSGIPSATALVDEWLRDLYEASETKNTFKEWANAEELQIPDFVYERRAESYSMIYDLRFKGRDEDGALHLEEKIEGKSPSYGYAVLAQLMGGFSKVVITTNFDNLASDALFQFGGQSPFICGHENMASYITSKIGRPMIIKLHRDILTSPINSQRGIASLAESLQSPLTDILKRHIPIFIGYGGNDESLMTFLKNLGDKIPDRVYWCQYKHETINNKVAEYLRNKNRWLVKIDGFDQIMKSLEDKLGLPDLMKALQRVNDQRLNQLRISRESLTDTIEQTLREDMREDRGDTMNTLRMRADLAGTLHEQGRYVEAEAELLEICEISKRLLGDDSRDTLGYRNNLANSIYLQKRYYEAEKMHREILSLREQTLGSENLDTLQSRNNLANSLASQGKHVEAEAHYREVLLLRYRLLGEENKDTLNTLNNLATSLSALEEYSEAEEKHRLVLAIRQRTLNSNHPDIFQSYHNLSVCLMRQGQTEEAHTYARRALEGWKNVMGEDHPNTEQTKELVNELESFPPEAGDGGGE